MVFPCCQESCQTLRSWCLTPPPSCSLSPPCRQRRNLRAVQQKRRRSRTLRPVPVPDDQLLQSGVQDGGTVGGDAPPEGTTAGGRMFLLCNKMWRIAPVKTGTKASFPFQMQSEPTCFTIVTTAPFLRRKNKSAEQQEEESNGK